MRIEKLVPHCMAYIWGGNRLATHYNKHSSSDIIAESWELSCHEDGLTRLCDGSTLRDMGSVEHLGRRCASIGTLPMLVKFIDAQQSLSVQVHPSDDYALQYEHSNGKTEMWYIVETSEGAGIYLGFTQQMTTQQISKAIQDNTLLDYLNFIPVKAGEHYWIDSGTIHAIGAGCVICEIQQSSNITYRVYDYDRVDSSGHKRPLHIDKALDVIDTSAYVDKSINVDVVGGALIGKCQYFTVHLCHVQDAITIDVDQDSFVCVVCTAGSGSIDGMPINQGDSYFVPAGYGQVGIDGRLDIVVVRA